MNKKMYLIALFVVLVSFISPVSVALAAEDGSNPASSGPIEIRVNENGFNGGGDYKLEVAQGQTVDIVFVWDDTKQVTNSHMLNIEGYGLITSTLNKDNPRQTLHFLATKVGTFRISCIFPCIGHSNLQKGTLIVKAAQAVLSPPSLLADNMVVTGKQLFNTKCAMCHGETGDKISTAKLASPDWLNNKGVDGVIQSIAKGKPPMMPAWGKAQGGTLSDDDIKAITKYLWNVAGISSESSGTDAAQVLSIQSENLDKSSTVKAQGVQKTSAPNLSLSMPDKWYRGGEASLSAVLTTSDGRPIKGETVSFYLDYNFFLGLQSGSISDKIEIGKAITDENGIARLKYAPRIGGPIKFEARYTGGATINGTGQPETLITTTVGQIEDNGHRFYRTEGGIPMPAMVRYSLVDRQPLDPRAPFKDLLNLRLPAVILGLLISGIWFTYLRIGYGILSISRVYTMSHLHSTRESFTQSKFLFPILLMVFIAIFALTLLSIVFTSPDTHLNLR